MQREAGSLKLNNFGFKFLGSTFIPEAAARRYSVEKVFLKICKNHRKTTVPESLILMKLQVSGLQLY